jgi:hypothetical protein
MEVISISKKMVNKALKKLVKHERISEFTFRRTIFNICKN